jgi:hypothetical protein
LAAEDNPLQVNSYQSAGNKMYKLVCSFFPAFLFFVAVYAADAAHIDTTRTAQKAKQALLFCKQRGYNTGYCILIDMSLHSGAKRFILWDIKRRRIALSGLLAMAAAAIHGRARGGGINQPLAMPMAAIVPHWANTV